MRTGWILAAVVVSSAVAAAALGSGSSPPAPTAPRVAAGPSEPAPVAVAAQPAAQDMHPAEGPVAAVNAQAMASAHGGSKLAVEPGSVARATGDAARTVAEIYAQAPALEGKAVRVAGRVVKVTPNVLGRTWLHVQDGSGTPDKGDFDLVATTDEQPEPGDVVVLEGTLARDKDLGAGYRYPVLLELAKVQRPEAGK
ncbi:MAG: hypothetical protein IT373_01170 [Polyangiaceae bacterium]|nr:hypothetical protein [Polyangiaceae bacterium]